MLDQLGADRPRRVIEVAERGGRHRAEVEGRRGRLPVGGAPEPLVVGVHLVPAVASRRGRAPVVLVEGPLAEQGHQPRAVELHGSVVEVVVDEAPARKDERLVEAAQLPPQLRRQEQGAALGDREEPALCRRAAKGADAEEAVAVLLPAGPGQEVVLGGLVEAGLGGLHVAGGAEVPPEAGDHRPVVQPPGLQGHVEEAGRGDPGTVDDEADRFPRRQADAEVRGPGRGRRGRVDPLEAVRARQVGEPAGVDGPG